MPQKSSTISLTLLAILLVGNSAVSEETTEPRPTVESAPEIAGELNPAAKPKLGPSMQRLVDLALEDMKTRFDIDKADVRINKAQFVTWRDTSAGCPRPDMQYAQVLTNGAQIVFRSADRIFNYHSGGNRPPFYCPKPSDAKPLPYSPGEA